MRNIVESLRPSTLDAYGLAVTLREYVEKQSLRTGLRIEVRGDLETRLPSEVELALFRVIQESITNIHKHAGATRAVIDLEEGSETVIVRIRDDGVGFDVSSPPSPEGLGILGMHERMNSIDGHLEIRSEPGAGAAILATATKP